MEFEAIYKVDLVQADPCVRVRISKKRHHPSGLSEIIRNFHPCDFVRILKASTDDYQKVTLMPI